MAESPNVTHHGSDMRFEAEFDGHHGELRYLRREAGGHCVMVIPTVVVDRAIEGRRVAGALVRAALEHARTQGWRVDPICPYVDAWMRRHPDVAELRA